MRPLVGLTLASIRRTFAAHLPLYACAILFCGASWAATAYFHVPLSLGASLFFLKLVPVFLMLGIGLSAARHFLVLARKRADRPLQEMGRWFAGNFLKGERPGNIVHGLIAFTPLMVSFAPSRTTFRSSRRSPGTPPSRIGTPSSALGARRGNGCSRCSATRRSRPRSTSSMTAGSR